MKFNEVRGCTQVEYPDGSSRLDAIVTNTHEIRLLDRGFALAGRSLDLKR